MDEVVDDKYTASRFLEFSLGTQKFAIPLLSVKEVISVPSVTPIPRSPNYFLGIMNLRGNIISILDLRKKLSIDPLENDSQVAVVIMDFQHFLLGIVVDSIDRVVHAEEAEFKDVPIAQQKADAKYIEGVLEKGDSLIVRLNIAKALNIEDLQLLKNHQEEAA